MNKRVGIITFHCSFNYGSVLQAYALQEFIASLGYKSKIINYIDKADFEQYRLFRTNSYKNNPKIVLADIVFFLQHRRRKVSFESFQKNHFRLTETFRSECDLSKLNSVFDIFVCGGDQIWNLNCTNGINGPYFLSFVNESKKLISYAPSMASDSFDSHYDNDLRKLLMRFNSISVRERDSVAYVERLISKKVTCAIDPTFLMERSFYESLIVNPNEHKHYVFAYMIADDERLIDYLMSLAESGVKVYFLSLHCYSSLKVKNLYGISPEKFLGYIKYADYVVTNSFHATIFSIIFEKRFLVFNKGASSSRISNLLDTLNLNERTDLSCINNSIDYNQVNSVLEKWKYESKEYLIKALGHEHE
ncbi:Polysaccharide pyruvyl transferase [Ruminococcaceae bacterium YAD3003]|nr:Polysaccharide pyruvyl transferase [Ruminococcaceae bacterium YAD3003]